MKKLALSMVAALAIFSVSCSSSDKAGDTADSAAQTEQADQNAPQQEQQGDVKSQIIALCTETVEAIKANPADADKIMEETNNKGNALTANLSQEEQQALMQDADILAAFDAMQKAYTEAKAGASTNGTEGGDLTLDPTLTPEDAQKAIEEAQKQVNNATEQAKEAIEAAQAL